MYHFIKYVKPTPSEPVLLLLDNHSSHIDINVIDKAKVNGIIMLSFLPHCTHRLQPLDVSVYGPFKSYCATAQDNWMRNNPGKTMSIYELPGIVKYAWPLASNSNNIMNGLKKTGIYPFNKSIFTDEDFAPSYVTDRPLLESREPPTYLIVEENNPQPEPSNINNTGQSSITSNLEGIDLSNNKTTSPFSPEIVRPLPKTPPRQRNSRRRVRKSAVLTDSPERNALAEEQRKRRKEDISSDAKKKGKGKGKGKDKRKVLQEDIESDDKEDSLEYYCIFCCDAYSKSQPEAQWIGCTQCKNWVHSKCIKNTVINKLFFVCPNCESDDSL